MNATDPIVEATPARDKRTTPRANQLDFELFLNRLAIQREQLRSLAADGQTDWPTLNTIAACLRSAGQMIALKDGTVSDQELVTQHRLDEASKVLDACALQIARLYDERTSDQIRWYE